MYSYDPPSDILNRFSPTSYPDSLLAGRLAGHGVDECPMAQAAPHLHKMAVHHTTVVPRRVAEARCHTEVGSWMEAVDIAGCGRNTGVDADVAGREEESCKVVALLEVSYSSNSTFGC
jgi:hypothetical protein